VATRNGPAPEEAAPALDEPGAVLDSEMVRYYAARAGEYDDWYLRRGRYSHGPVNDAAWRMDMDAAAAWLSGLSFGRNIAELAAGTGWWSPLLAALGRLTLYDASAEPLEIARERLAAAGLSAEFEIRDAWAEPDRSVGGVFTGFWISHVDRARLGEFFDLVARWLVPGGCFAFIDSRRDPESSAVDHSPPEDDVQVRRLDDGSTYRVRKIYYEPPELAAALGRAGFDQIEVTTTDRFFLIGCARRK
jgi:demethylmenaquinone methyltransferase/2-methoxy-6-polyprenyl-1,4-benzoquinol methylase